MRAHTSKVVKARFAKKNVQICIRRSLRSCCILRPDDRAVLLVMSKKLFKGAVKDLPFRVVAEHMVSIGGLGGGINVIEPATSVPPQPTEAKSSTIGQKRSASSVST
ncbi:hypothetical protein Pcac1_g26871 [Phytophthora cactorum]|nr:hypothetical protein Pcac1_g26871 [Phytophthora cactorum]